MIFDAKTAKLVEQAAKAGMMLHAERVNGTVFILDVNDHNAAAMLRSLEASPPPDIVTVLLVIPRDEAIACFAAGAADTDSPAKARDLAARSARELMRMKGIGVVVFAFGNVNVLEAERTTADVGAN